MFFSIFTSAATTVSKPTTTPLVLVLFYFGFTSGNQWGSCHHAPTERPPVCCEGQHRAYVIVTLLPQGFLFFNKLCISILSGFEKQRECPCFLFRMFFININYNFRREKTLSTFYPKPILSNDSVSRAIRDVIIFSPPRFSVFRIVKYGARASTKNQVEHSRRTKKHLPR